MLDISLSNGENGWNFIQFNGVRQLREALLDIYSATDTAHSSCYSFKSHHGRVLHMYEGVIQSLLMDRFTKDMKKRIS